LEKFGQCPLELKTDEAIVRHEKKNRTAFGRKEDTCPSKKNMGAVEELIIPQQ